MCKTILSLITIGENSKIEGEHVLLGENVMLAYGGKEPKAEIFKYFNESMDTLIGSGKLLVSSSCMIQIEDILMGFPWT